MKETLIKLGLIEHLTTELEIQKDVFVNKLKDIVDPGYLGFFSEPFPSFSSNAKDYRGRVSLEGFTIKKRRTMFDNTSNLAIASGTYSQRGSKLVIQTEIKGFNVKFVPFYAIAIIAYSVLFFVLVMADRTQTKDLPFILTLLFIHAVLLLGLPILIMRRSTKRLKRDLEREFYFLTKP
jgi:hypothetical protein